MSAARTRGDGSGYYFDYGADTPKVRASQAALEDIIAQIMSSEGLTRDQVEYKLNASSDSRNYLPAEYNDSLKDVGFERNTNDPDDDWEPSWLKESDGDLWDQALKHHKYQLRIGMSAARTRGDGSGYYFDYGADTPKVRASQAALEDIIAQIMSSEGLTRDQVEYKLNASSDSRNYLPAEYNDSLKDVGFERNTNDPDDHWEP